MRRELKKKSFIALLMLLALLLGSAPFVVAQVVVAQEADEETEEGDDRKEALEDRIRQIEKEIAGLDQELYGVSQQANTLQGEVNRLNATIRRSELAIQGLNLSLSQTEAQIDGREQAIEKTEEEIDGEKEVLAEFLRQFHKSGDRSLVEMMLSKDLSEFFREFDALEVMQDEAQITLAQLRDLKAGLEHEKEILGEKHEEYAGLRSVEVTEKQAVEVHKAEKNELLQVTRGEEARYQTLISQKQRDIAAIRQQINSLSRAGISTENAVEAAEIAARGTGIRTAFLLGLLEVETGRRFAQGVITAGSYTGSGNWRYDMNPSQHACFLAVTSRLGLNPDSVKVSAKPAYGWGGAMGVAQFIPCTWERYQARVSQITGNTPSNPWKLIDGFTAAALYLADFGAAQQSYAAETAAAKAYISGRPSCSSSICNWYASEVLRVASMIQQSL